MSEDESLQGYGHGHAVMILAVLLPLLMAAAFLLGRHLQRRQSYHDELSPSAGSTSTCSRAAS